MGNERINKLLKEKMAKENMELLLTDKELNEINLVNRDKIQYECPKCGTRYETTIYNILDSRRTSPLCTFCASKEKFLSTMTKKYGRIPYEFITDFKGFEEPIKVKCLDCGFIFEEKKAKALLMNSKLKGTNHPCKQCTKNRRNTTKNINELYDLLKNKFGKCEYELVEPEKFAGIHSKEKYKIRCTKCGNEFTTYLNNIINPTNGSHYCAVCNNSVKRVNPKETYKEHCLKVSNGNIEPLDEYIDASTKIRHKCLRCGYGSDGSWFKLPIGNNLRGTGCPRCSNKIAQSACEREIVKFIEKIYTDEIIKKWRGLETEEGTNQEIDVYLPNKKIGIEIDGLYWHSEKYKGKDYHINKTNLAHEQGIRLIHIFSDEWYQHEEIVKMKLKTILGLNNDKNIYARKCTVKEVSPGVKNEFLNKYHIQGEDTAKFKLGLFYKDELVAVMTFCSPRISTGGKNKNNGEYELSRFATKYHIVGGFSKLLKHALNMYPEILTVKTFADIRWSDMDNNVYTKNGFTLLRKSEPSYWCFDSHKSESSAVRMHRYGFSKGNLKKKFPDLYDPKLTEKEIQDKTNYKRVYDCGNLVYELKR